MLLGLALLGAVVTVPGCGGCLKPGDKQASKDGKKKEKKKKQEPKKDYEIGKLETLPSDNTLNRNFVKPGHAVTAWVPVVANNHDLRAEFETSVTDVANRPVLIGDTNYHLVMSRPAVLPKGQGKFLESTFFIPLESGDRTRNLFLRHKLKRARGGQTLYENSQVTQAMPGHQYLFAVLSTNPNAFGYVKQLESISPFYDSLLDAEGEIVYYRVVLPSIDQRMPLPSHPFAWTSLAYVLWDGAQPSSLAPGQQQAMLDWLHWGGQLIVSGPTSLEALAGSFLDPYLPATAGDAVELGAPELDALNQAWSLTSKESGERLALVVPEATPMVGSTLEKRPEAEFMQGTGQLVAERRVGQGRVVVTAFSLADRDFINWGSGDSFFNGCLLRRPARKFVANDIGLVRPTWDLPSLGRDSPLVVTSLRYFTRDVGTPVDRSEDVESTELDWHLDGCEPHPVSGLGGWDDHSGASNVARATLKKAAGVSIPDASFVLSALVVYLVVLVPVNWAICRMLGRVEWAWVAAPIIAIIGAIAVIRLAQLDIGFVRSRTEIAIVELQGGYPRAHVTRYAALYSSLSSNYEFRFEDTSAMSRPFPPTYSPDRLWPVTYRRDRDVSLSGIQVQSNTTGFVHSEQMFDAGGAIQLLGSNASQWQVRNDSELILHHVGVVHRTAAGAVHTYWVGDLAPKASVPLQLAPTKVPGQVWLEEWEIRPGDVTAPQSVTDLEELTLLAARGTRLRCGDVRLIGWTDGFLPGLTIAPGASQTESSGVVLVHLRRGPLSPARPDTNIAADVRESIDLGGILDEATPLLPSRKRNPQ